MILPFKTIELVEVPCPICQSTSWRLLAKFVDWTYGIGGPFRSVRCSSCGHRYLNPRPTDESLLKCYPEQYGPHHLDRRVKLLHAENGSDQGQVQRVAMDESKRSFQVLRKLWRRWLDNRSTWMPTIEHAKVSSSPMALEIGCADGWFCQQLADAGWDIQGIEPVAAAAERARARGIRVHVGTVQDVFVPSQSMDFVAAWMVLEHLPNPVESVQRIGKWVKPGGTFAFSVPNAASLDRFVFGRHWSGYDGGRHLQFYTPRSLAELLAKGDFRIERAIHQNTIQPFVGSIGSLVHSLWPASRIAKRLSAVYMNEISFRARVLCSPLANLVAGVYLSSRITVIARKNT